MCRFQTKLLLVYLYTQISFSTLTTATEHPQNASVKCPPQDVTLKMTGATAGNEVVRAWTRVYSTELCPGFNVTFEENAWDAGAARVCDSSLVQDSVDIASMSGPFFPPQASTTDGWNFQCRRSKQARETILVSTVPTSTSQTAS